MDGPYPAPNPPSIKGIRRGVPDSNPPVAFSGVLSILSKATSIVVVIVFVVVAQMPPVVWTKDKDKERSGAAARAVTVSLQLKLNQS